MNSPLASTVSLPGTSQRTSLLRQVFEGSAWNGLAIAVNRLAPSLLTILLAWWLDPKELGTLALVMAYYGILSLLADWSIAYSLQKLIPENVASSAEIAWTALCIRFLFSGLIAFLCWGLDLATAVFRGYGAHLGLLLVSSSFGIIVYVYYARCRFAWGSFLSIAFHIGWIGAAVILVKLGMHITGPLFALAGSFAFFGFPAFMFELSRATAKFSSKFAAEIIRFGTWATLASALAGVAAQGGLLILAYISGDSFAGIYRVAATFGMLPAILGMVVMSPLMPVVKRGLLDGSEVGATLILPILRNLLMVGLVIVATSAMFADSIIRTFVRESYSSAAWPMCICLVASLFQMLVTTFSAILLVGDGLRDLSKIHGVIALIAVAGSIFLVLLMHANGPALASLAAWLVGGVLLNRWFARRALLPLEWGSYVRYVISACVSAGMAGLATQTIVSPQIRFSLGGSLSLTVYLTLLWLQHDRSLLQLWRALRRSVPDQIALSLLKVLRVD